MNRLSAFAQRRKQSRDQLIYTALAVALAACSAGSSAAESAADLEQRFMDGWREGKIETIYRLNPHLSDAAIDAEVKGTSLVLSGEVDEEIDRELAEAIARGVDGIGSVDNRIVVVPAKPQPAAEAAAAQPDLKQTLQDITTTTLVKGKLLRSPHIAGLDINVDTVNGQVTLEGEVASSAAKDLAWRLAKNTHGVVAVENRLTVRPENTEGSDS
ncbi:BON domain-containing protein [Porticoccus sp.]